MPSVTVPFHKDGDLSMGGEGISGGESTVRDVELQCEERGRLRGGRWLVEGDEGLE